MPASPNKHQQKAAVVKPRALLVQDPVRSNSLSVYILLACFAGALFGSVNVSKAMYESLPVDTSIKNTGGEQCKVFDLQTIPDYLGGAVPFFFMLMAVEYVLLRFSGLHSTASKFTAVDTWGSVVSGASQFIWFEVFLRVFNMRGLYCRIWVNYKCFTLPDTWVGYIIAFVIDDFVYYLFHWASHAVGFLWLGHAPHHSSERYNLSTAVRQGYWQWMTHEMFGLVMAPFVPPKHHFLVHPFLFISQYWFHTCLIRRLPAWFEFIFNTPSHHRVHHDRRVHKNYGGALIIFDRIFGTFRDERECDTDDKGTLPDDELVLFGIQDEVKSWTEAPMQTQWLVDHGLRHPKNLIVGPGFHVSRVDRRLPAVSNVPRIRQDDSSRGTLTNVFLVVSFLHSFISSIVALKINTPQTTTAILVMAGVTTAGWYVHGLVCDRSYKVALMMEAARFVFALFAGPAAVPPYTAVASLVSLVWIAGIWGQAPTRLCVPGKKML